jgi:hypothetical protein
MFIYYKTTVWERFEVGDEHKESLLELLKENPKTSAMDIWNWYSDNGGDPHRETIEETYEDMSVEDNSGNYTIEIVCDDKTIYQNGAE